MKFVIPFYYPQPLKYLSRQNNISSKLMILYIFDKLLNGSFVFISQSSLCYITKLTVCFNFQGL